MLDWVTEEYSTDKNLVPLISKGFVLEQLEEEKQEETVTKVHLENGLLNAHRSVVV